MPLAPIKYRTDDVAKWGTGLGHNLAAVDFDLNFWNVDQRLVALETADPPTALGLRDTDPFTFVGNIMTIHLNDGSTRGPFLIKVGWVLRGPWEAGATYLENNLLIGPDQAAYMVQTNHVAAPTFDANATDGSGHKLYALLLPATVPAVPINDIHVFVPGLMANGQLILHYNSTRRWTLAANLVGSIFSSGTPATAATVINIYRNTALIGTLTWAAGAFTPTVFFQFRVDFNVGDGFELIGPLVADVGLSDTAFDIVGNRL
jgi:hypothetical protein